MKTSPHTGRSATSCVAAALLTLFLSFGVTSEASAQAYGRVDETRSNADSYHYFVQSGAATIQVQVLGTVKAPGLYEISEGTDLGQLLALAGGPPLGVRSRHTRVHATLRLYRPSAAGQELVYEEALEQAIANPQAYPVLRDGDVVTMEVIQRQLFDWRDVTRIVSTVGILALAVDRFSRVVN